MIWIYWKEHCKYCINRENCKYKVRVAEYTEAITKLEDEYKDIYGSTVFECDYYVPDDEKIKKENVGEIYE